MAVPTAATIVPLRALPQLGLTRPDWGSGEAAWVTPFVVAA